MLKKFTKAETRLVIAEAAKYHPEFNFRGEIVKVVDGWESLRELEAEALDGSGKMSIDMREQVNVQLVLNHLSIEFQDRMHDVCRKRRNAARNRIDRHEIMKDHGMVKVKGCVSGQTYYE